MTLTDFARKLGADAVAEYPVYNHNPFWGNTYVGKAANGVPLFLNNELVKCDVIIGMGTILPHINVGFSVGGKLLCPGGCGIDRIRDQHVLPGK